MKKEKILAVNKHIAGVFGIELSGIKYKKDFDTDMNIHKFYIDDVTKILNISDIALKDLSIEELLKKISMAKSLIINDNEVFITAGY